MSEPWHGGKGDRDRTKDRVRYEAGYDMIFGETPEIRSAARLRWLDLHPHFKDIQHYAPDRQDPT